MRQREPKASRPWMPGYGILDENSGKGLLPWTWARDHLAAVPYYWVATTRPDGRPHAMAVWGIWTDDVFYFSTGRDSQKSRNLKAKPQCVISVAQGDDAVVVEGTARETTDSSLILKLSEIYKAKYGMPLDPALGPVYAVRPAVVFGLIGTTHERFGIGDFAATATRWQFDS